MKSPKEAQPAKTTGSAARKSACISDLSRLHDDGGDGFYISPLTEEPTDDEVREIWRSAAVSQDC